MFRFYKAYVTINAIDDEGRPVRPKQLLHSILPASMEEPEEQEVLAWANLTVRPGITYAILNNRSAARVITITLKHLARKHSMTRIIEHATLKSFVKRGKWSSRTSTPNREANTTTAKRNAITIITTTSTASVTLAVIGKPKDERFWWNFLRNERVMLNWMGLIRNKLDPFIIGINYSWNPKCVFIRFP